MIWDTSDPGPALTRVMQALSDASTVEGTEITGSPAVDLTARQRNPI